jgi:hypothetical protein
VYNYSCMYTSNICQELHYDEITVNIWPCGNLPHVPAFFGHLQDSIQQTKRHVASYNTDVQ